MKESNLPKKRCKQPNKGTSQNVIRHVLPPKKLVTVMKASILIQILTKIVKTLKTFAPCVVKMKWVINFLYQEMLALKIAKLMIERQEIGFGSRHQMQLNFDHNISYL